MYSFESAIERIADLESKLLHTETALSTERAQKKEIGERLLTAEGKLDSAYSEITENRRYIGEHIATITKLENKLNADSQNFQIECQKAEIESLASRLDSALKFVDYIAKRYENGWDEPITERFYNEAKALLPKDSPK